MKSMPALLFALAIGVAAVPAAAGDAVKGPIAVTGAWARATPPGAKNGAAFLSVGNGGGEDRVIGARAAVSDKVELHTHLAGSDGVMRMRPVESIPLASGQKVTLEPGGMHVMLIGLKQPLKQGSHFPLTVVLDKAGEVTVEVDVQGPGAAGPMMMQHDPAQHEQHMADPAHRQMHEMMHGK